MFFTSVLSLAEYIEEIKRVLFLMRKHKHRVRIKLSASHEAKRRRSENLPDPMSSNFSKTCGPSNIYANRWIRARPVY